MVIVSQIGDLFIRRAIVPVGRERPLERWEDFALAVCNIQASTIYGSVAVLAWFAPDEGFRIFAGFWLSGSMVHVILHMHHHKPTFITSFVPHAVHVVGLAATSLFMRDGVMVTNAALLFAGSMFIIYAVTAYRAWGKASGELQRARAEAEERRAIAEQASASKSTFLATLSHEIRTPMNGILGMAAALEESDIGPEERQKVRVLRQASDLLLVLLNDVLDMSKIEAGKIELEVKPFHIGEVIERVAALHGTEAERKGLILRSELSAAMPLRWIGDEHRIVQVLHNLTGNAVKFTGEGEVVLGLAPLEEGKGIVLTVRDTGIGMSAEERARVFEPFTQADSSTTRVYGGTGLGLTITNGLIEAMGGTLSVESEKGEGTTFIIRLPLMGADTERTPAAATTEPAQGLDGLRILAVDDNRVNLAVLDTLLSREGAHVVLANSGQIALELFEPTSFDLVLLDISMPHLDGPEVLRRLMDTYSGGRLPPVIAVSAHAMQEDIDRFLSEGFSGYVTKPVRIAALRNAATAALGLVGEAEASPTERRS
jgi:signal transduction histidine kinase/CheY-like chemotaxis protein